MSSAATRSDANLLRCFDAVYLLNLPERTDRLHAAMAQLTAVDEDARELVKVFAGTRATEAHGFPSVGAYGCFQGHLGILRAARDAGARSVLVLEDDIRFLPNLLRDWPAVEVALKREPWTLVNLGFDSSVETPDQQVGDNSPLVRVETPLMLAHCYAVNGSVLPELIDFLEKLQARPYGDPAGGPMHYDGALFHFCTANPHLLRLRPVRSLAGQRSSRSDIAEGRWFDRNPLLRPIVAMLRGLRESRSI